MRALNRIAVPYEMVGVCTRQATIARVGDPNFVADWRTLLAPFIFLSLQESDDGGEGRRGVFTRPRGVLAPFNFRCLAPTVFSAAVPVVRR